jgi:hypothetical protein
MKGKVTENFMDKETKKLRVIGDVVEYSEKRFKELQAGGYIKPVEAARARQEAAQTPTA